MKGSTIVAGGVFVVAHGLLVVLWFDWGGLPTEIIGLVCFTFFVVWQAYVHEAAHFFAAYWAGAQDIRLKTSRKGFRVSYTLNHSPLKLAFISAAGPASGVLLGIVGLWFAQLWGNAHQAWATWLTMISLIGCAQAAFLLPFAPDGNVFAESIWGLITRKKGIYEN